MALLVRLLALAAALFHLYSAGVSPFTALVQRPVHLAFMAALGFLGVGVRNRLGTPLGAQVQAERNESRRAESGSADPDATVEVELETGPTGLRGRLSIAACWALAIASVLTCAYLATQAETLVRRSGAPTNLDLIAAGVALFVVLDLTRRATGWGLVVVALAALGYAGAGPWLPGILAHRGYSPTRVLEHLYLSTEGIWGIPLGVSADFVYLFILFGALLEMAGGGALLIGLADRIAGRSRGGPAKTAAVGSALMGSLSGSAVANVVTTGAFTIPLMRRAGFKPAFAGAIEAAASTGGQLMPPVMGAGAFILAAWTGIPYGRVALAALIPSVLYYMALLAAIHFRAGRMGLEPTEEHEREEVLAKLHLLLPLLIIVVLLAQGRSPMRAAFWGVLSTLGMSFLRPATRMSVSRLGDALLKAASGAVQVAAACAAAGIVVGVASLTGIGLRMSELIMLLSGGNLLAALLLTALGSIVLGMGLPTTAAYVVLAALGAPALTELGVPLLGAHFFIFYFGCLSNVTPPVALASYAAAGVSGAPAFQTAIYGAILALPGFLVPFLFVYHPALLLEGTGLEIAQSAFTAGLGVVALAAGTIGFLIRRLAVWERVLLIGVAFTLITPSIWTDLIGLVVAIVLWLWVRSSPGDRDAELGAVAT